MKKALASREGWAGEVTAAGLLIRPDSIFVALPSQRALWHCVRVRINGLSIVAVVLDVGPWFPFGEYFADDDYVFSTARPRAEAMRGQVRNGDVSELKINGAGIDLSDGLLRHFRIEPSKWGLREVEWEFVE